MSGITTAIKKAFKVAKDRNWTGAIYFAFDIHDTIIVPNYKLGDIPKDFYPGAKEVMRMISDRRDVDMILYTCSWPNEIEQYIKLFESEEIYFKFINENPDVPSKDYGCYDKKFYCNVLFEDKAGFDPNKDWERVRKLMEKIPLIPPTPEEDE